MFGDDEVNLGQNYYPDDTPPDPLCADGSYPDRYCKEVIICTDVETSPDNSGSRLRTKTYEVSKFTNVPIVDTDIVEYGNENTLIPNPERPWELDSEEIIFNTATHYKRIRYYSFADDPDEGTWVSTREIIMSELHTFAEFLGTAAALYGEIGEAAILAAAPDNSLYVKTYWYNDSGILEELGGFTSAIDNPWWPVDAAPDAYYVVGRDDVLGLLVNGPQFEGMKSVRVPLIPDFGKITLEDGPMKYHQITVPGSCDDTETETVTDINFSGVDHVFTQCSTYGYEIYRPVPE